MFQHGDMSIALVFLVFVELPQESHQEKVIA
jgi:hypothetical protein